MPSTALRVFVSSPGDVGFERRVALAVIERLRGEFHAHVDVQPVLWEQQPLRATEHFQEQIAHTGEVDIAVFVLWTRLGTALPGQFAREDGTPFASGTEFEFESAARAFRATGKPAMLAYIKRAERTVQLSDRAAAMEAFAQKDALDRFVDQWFGSHRSSFRAAFKGFETADEFEHMLEADLRHLIGETRPAGGAPTTSHVTWSRGSPFRGLSAFEFEHAPVFFGRTRAIDDVCRALVAQAARGCAFVLVLGMSGSGKSSLVHAGLLPALTQPGVIEGVQWWCWSSLRPSGHQTQLMHGLANSLLQGLTAADAAAILPGPSALTALLRDSPSSAADELAAALQRIADARRAALGLQRPPVARMIVAIDQFEELFALDAISAQERQAFVAALDALARSGHIWVVATMRSDFYSRCAELPALVRLKEGAGQFELLPPLRREIEQMVRASASAAGLYFERSADSGAALDETLIDAAASNPAALPLLEFALEELYRRRTPDGGLSFAAYREFGGLEGAIGRRAEEVHAQLPAEAQACLPGVFAQMITLHLDEAQGSPRASAVRVPRGQLPEGPPIDAILNAFVTARLFVSDRTATGEAAFSLAHEALLSHWPRLARWVADNEVFLEQRAHLQIEARQWQAHGRDEAHLIAGGDPLDKAEDFLARKGNAVPREIVEHITASTRRRRSSGKFVWLGVAALLALFVVWDLVGTVLRKGPAALRLEQVMPYAAVVIWMLFLAHLRWRAEPKRVARRKALLFTVLISGALLLAVWWRVAFGIEADGWRADTINFVSPVMLIAYGTYVALDQLYPQSSTLHARRRKRFLLLFGIASVTLFAMLPVGFVFGGGPQDRLFALSLLIAAGTVVLLITFAMPSGRRVPLQSAGTPGGPTSTNAPDRIADTVLVVLVLSVSMFFMPPLIESLRSRVELCGDIDGFFDNPRLRCLGAPHPGFATIRLERQGAGGQVNRMKFVDAKGKCDSRLPLMPKLQILRELELVETGMSFRTQCASMLSYDSAGNWNGETLQDAEGTRLMQTEKVEETIFLYGEKPGVYLGRMRRPADARDGEIVVLAEFNAHRIWLRNSDAAVQEPLPARRWEFNPEGWPIRIMHVDVAGKPVLASAIGYARVELRYAGNGSLLEALFFDAQHKPIALKDGYAAITWEYDSAGACVRRIDVSETGQRLRESSCK